MADGGAVMIVVALSAFMILFIGGAFARQNAECRSALCHDLRPSSFVRPPQSERVVYLTNGLTYNHQIL